MSIVIDMIYREERLNGLATTGTHPAVMVEHDFLTSCIICRAPLLPKFTPIGIYVVPILRIPRLFVYGFAFFVLEPIFFLMSLNMFDVFSSPTLRASVSPSTYLILGEQLPKHAFHIVGFVLLSWRQAREQGIFLGFVDHQPCRIG